MPTADLADAKYGPHERNVLDVWKARSDRPTPLVIFFHGGGFYAGDKSNVSPALVEGLLKSGISVASSNYRLSQHAPFPAPFADCARAVQFLRSKAGEWNIDPKRIAVSGYSAGAGVALWLNFHDDMADPKSDDPILRQSTKVTCAAVHGGPASFDPRWIRKNMGGRTTEHPAFQKLFGLKDDERDTPRAHQMYEEASPINFISADDGPALLYYGEAKPPLKPSAMGIHHHQYGLLMKEKLDALKSNARSSTITTSTRRCTPT